MRSVRTAVLMLLVVVATGAFAAPAASAASYVYSSTPSAGSNGWSWAQTGGFSPGTNRCDTTATTIPTNGYCALRWDVPAGLDAVGGTLSGQYRQSNSAFEHHGVVECNGNTVLQGTATAQNYTRGWPDMCSYLYIAVVNAGAAQSVSASSQWFTATAFSVTLVDPSSPALSILDGHTGWKGAGGACVRYGFTDAGSGLDSTALVRQADSATYDNPSYASSNITTGVFSNDRNCVGVPAPGSGTWTYEARAIDKSGNYSATPFGVSFDLTTPTATTAFVQSSSTEDQTPTINVAVADAHSGLASVTATIDGAAAPLTTPAAGQREWTPAADLVHGAHTFVMTVTDNMGYVTTLTRDFTVVDTTVPAVTVTPPSTAWRSTCAPVSYTATDAGTGVWTMRVVEGAGPTLVDDFTRTGNVSAAHPGDASRTRTPCVTPSTGTSGSYSYTPRAIDQGGLTGNGTAFTINYDVSAPTATTAFVEGSSTEDQTPTINVAVADAHSGLASVTATMDGSAAPLTTPAVGQREWTPAADLTHGAHAFVMTVTDGAGNAATLTRNFTVVDTTVPVVTVTPPSTAWRSTCAPVSYTATDAGSGVWTMQLLEDATTVVDSFTRSSDVSPAQPGDASSTRTPCVTPTGSGSYTYTARGIDKSGNIGNATATFTIQYDVEAPTASTSLVDGSSSEDQTPTATFLVTDPDSGLASVAATIDGSPVPLVDLGGGNYELTPSEDLPHGTHTYALLMTDVLGNTSTITRTFTIADVTAPALFVVEPSTAWRTTCATVAYTATDAGSGVWTMQLLEAGVTPIDSFTRSSNVSAAHPGDATSTRSPCVLPPASGSYSYTARAVDQAGNANTAAAFTINYDVTQPTVTPSISNGVSIEASTPQIDVLATDAHSGIASVVATLDNDVVTLTTPVAGTWRYVPASDLALGSHTFEAVVTDNAGNTRTSTRTFTIVDATVPALSLDLMFGSEPRSTCAPLNYLATDAMSGVWTMQIIQSGGGVIDDATRATPISAAHPGDLSIERFHCIVPPGTGTFTYTARAVDYAGNATTSSTFTIAFDVNLPTLATPMVNGASFENHRPTITFNGSDSESAIHGVYASINGESIAVTQLAAGSYTLAPPVDLGLGAHVVILGLIDAAGNIRQVTRTINVVDTTDPALTVATPSTVWHRTCAPMSYRADDAMSGVWDMRIVRSGGAVADSYTRTTPRTVSIPGDLSIDRSPCLVPPSSGTFSYTATSADYAGNDVTGASFDVRFDVTDPTASINVTNGAEYNVPRPELVLTADDAHSGIAAIAATLDGATITPSSVNGSTRSYQPATALSLGAHALAVTVTDNAGNVATLTRSFTIVDETAPAVTLEMPPSGAGSSTVTVGVDDGASGVDPDSWRVQVNNVDLIVQGTTTGLTFALPALVNGTHKVAIAVDDLDGNRTTRLVDYVVDNKNGVYPVTWEQTSAITVYDAPPIARRGSTYPVKAIVAFGGRAVPGTADVLKNGVVVASAPIAPTGAVSINIPIDDGTPLRIVAPRQPELSAQLIWSYDSAETCNGLPVAESGCEDDKTAPTVTVVAVQQPRGKLLRSKSATVRVTSSELGLVTLALPGAKATTKAVARQKATTVTLRLTPPILKALKKAQDAKKKTFVISLRLTATDARSNAIAPRTIRLSFKL